MEPQTAFTEQMQQAHPALAHSERWLWDRALEAMSPLPSGGPAFCQAPRGVMHPPSRSSHSGNEKHPRATPRRCGTLHLHGAEGIARAAILPSVRIHGFAVVPQGVLGPCKIEMRTPTRMAAPLSTPLTKHLLSVNAVCGACFASS